MREKPRSVSGICVRVAEDQRASAAALASTHSRPPP